mgnify:CR=1 FL=1
MRSAFSKLAWLGIGALAVIALLEVVLRCLPVSMGLYRTEQANRWPLISYEPHLPYAYSFTWAMLNAHRGVTNNYGHIAPFDYRPGSRPLIVVGDSFVESLMNDYADTLQGQLAARLGPGAPVYGLGVSGLSASDYVALARQAKEEFRPAAAVIVLIDGDIGESLTPRLGNYYLAPESGGLALRYLPMPASSAMKRIRKQIGDISLYRYFQANLAFSPEALLQPLRPAAAHAAASDRADRDVQRQRQAVEWFLAELPAAAGLPPECIVLLLDGDRYALYDPRQASTPKDRPETRSALIAEAARRGFRVGDLGPAFRAAYRANHEKLDYWPFDRHWNRAGHGVAAAEAHRLLYGEGRGAACRPGTERSP